LWQDSFWNDPIWASNWRMLLVEAEEMPTPMENSARASTLSGISVSITWSATFFCLATLRNASNMITGTTC
jgi:hypothetical protein